MRIVSIIGFLLLVAAISGLSSLVTMPAVAGWYQEINKPFWTPPDWVFGPVWTTLYAMIAVSGWLVWQKLPGSFLTRLKAPAMRAYWLQLLLNFLWSLIFFGMGHWLLGAVDILALLLAIIWNIRSFARVRKSAAWLLVPYLLWVAYASTLNIGIVALN